MSAVTLRRVEAGHGAGGRFAPSQAGFTLVESMVALLVISVGMIGIAALTTQGLGAGRTAQFRIRAVNLAADMADRIRANRLGRAGYSEAAEAEDCDGDADCVPSSVAAQDLAEWQENVTALLPDGEGVVRFDAATLPPSFVIELSWNEVGIGSVSYRSVVQVAGR